MSQYAKKYTMSSGYFNLGDLHGFLADFYLTTGVEPAKIYLSGDLFLNLCTTMGVGALVPLEKGKKHTPNILTQFGYLPVYPRNASGIVLTVVIDMDESVMNKAVESMLRGEDE